MRDAGQLRHELQVQEQVSTPDGVGGRTKVWTDRGAPIWGDMVPARAREAVEAERLTPTYAYRVRVHAVEATGITEAMALVVNGQRHAIQAIDTSDMHWAYIDVERGRAA